MLRIPGLLPLLALGLTAGAGLADPLPARRVHQVAPGAAAPPVVVVRGVLPPEPATAPDAAMAFELALAQMLGDLCRLDPRPGASAAADHLMPPLPAGF